MSYDSQDLGSQNLEELLSSMKTPEPPADLLDRLKDDIPEEISVAPSESPPAKIFTFPTRTTRTWLAAAAVVMMVGAGGLLVTRPMGNSWEDSLVAYESQAAGTRSGDAPTVEQRPETQIAESLGREASRSAPEAAMDDVSSASQASPPKLVQPAPQEKQESVELRRDLRQAPPPPPSRAKKEIPKPKAKRVPVADAAPRDAEPQVVGRLRKDQDAGAPAVLAEEMQAELKALGYVAEMEDAAVAAAPARAEKLRLAPAAPEPPATGAPPSTGGNAEPNDQPHGDMFFEGYGTNPFIDTEDDRLSTFGLDVDTASYTVARRYLRDGRLPPKDAVRVEEFVNFFDYGDRPPEEDDFAIHAEGAPSIFAEGERYRLLRFNLHGREIDDSQRDAAMLTFVIDVSGSMNQENRLGLVKKALGLLIDELREDDQVALVIYGSQARAILHPTNDREALRHAIDNLRSGGSTNAEDGLRIAYEIAASQAKPGIINRVILCSDGVANVGRTGRDSIWDVIKNRAAQGVELTTVGFGMGNYNDVLMEQLADGGNGRYVYVDSLDEARRVFVEDLTGTLQTIAAEARVQVEFNPDVVARYRLIGYENRDIADERFRDDTVDAGEIGAGHTVTALYEVKLHRELTKRDQVATLHLRWASRSAGEMREISRAVSGRDFAKSWDDASPALRLTSLVAEYAEILKQTYWSRDGDLDDVFTRAQKVQTEFSGDADVAEWVGLVGRAARQKR